MCFFMMVSQAGVGAPRDVAEFEPRVDLSMGRKIIEIPQENESVSYTHLTLPTTPYV